MRRTPSWPRSTVALALFAVGLALTAFAGATALPTGHSPAGAVRIPLTPGATPAAPAASLPLTLSAGLNPTRICSLGLANCSAQGGVTRVTLEADTPTAPTVYWPNVQVAFVVETSPYDGVYYHGYTEPGLDSCAAGNSQAPVCEESNLVPFFMTHAGDIAAEVSTANPHSQVSFALVDYFATDFGDWSDGLRDGTKYHVDIPQFTPASNFQTAVTQYFTNDEFGGHPYGTYGMDDNFLHSSSITALFGTIIGSGLDWSPTSHHVIVLLTSTAPQDPHYPENYCVSAYDPEGLAQHFHGPGCYGSTCGPAFTFANGRMPPCEGWVTSQDGFPQDSIGALAHDAPTCTASVGGSCTIDVVDVYDTATDPYSSGWPTDFSNSGGGPGGPLVLQDAQNVIFAGCDLSAATGGSWDGPAGAPCPNGTIGDLPYVSHGPVLAPNDENPGLLAALGRVAFGPVVIADVALGADVPMFRFVPFGEIAVASDPGWQTACATPSGYLPTCPQDPTISRSGNAIAYSWNWSTNPSSNLLTVGERWTVSFNVQANGLESGPIPVDACVTAGCTSVGSGPVSGLYTSATYLLPANLTKVEQSFPVAEVTVVPFPISGGPPGGLGGPPPALLPPVALPPFPPPPAITSPLVPPAISVQATAAGVLGAGFLRLGLKRPIGVRVANVVSPNRAGGSRFDTSPGFKVQRPPPGRFE